MPTNPSNADAVTRTMPVLIGSLIMGMVMFGGVASYLGPQNAKNAPANLDTLFIVAGVLTFVAMLGYLFFGKLTVSAARRAAADRTGDGEKRDAAAAVLMQNSIIRAALWEGLGLLGAVITLISGNMLGLAFTGLAVVMTATLLPAGPRLEALMRRISDRPFGH